jgi:aryl-alcohol dehydrogenase-like predicted oxidoreductase
VKGSLERLGLDYIDVLQCHRFDYETPIEETMIALHDVVKAGWVRYIGMSSCWAWQFQLMHREWPIIYDSAVYVTRTDGCSEYALDNHLTPFISMQNQHSALYREEEREVMPMLKHYGVGSIPWGPMAAGCECLCFE